MAKKVLKEKLAQRQSWPYFLEAFHRGEYVALRKLAHDCVPMYFLGNQLSLWRFNSGSLQGESMNKVPESGQEGV